MYLKRVYARDGYHYILSESCYDDECWKHRPLINLGPDPGTYIEYPGGNSFHVKESLLERVQDMAESFSEDELEALLMPFLDPHIRRIVERFERPGEPAKPWRSLSPDRCWHSRKSSTLLISVDSITFVSGGSKWEIWIADPGDSFRFFPKKAEMKSKP